MKKFRVLVLDEFGVVNDVSNISAMNQVKALEVAIETARYCEYQEMVWSEVSSEAEYWDWTNADLTWEEYKAQRNKHKEHDND